MEKLNLIVVGVTKCVTTSLSKYLKSKGHKVIDFETLATLKNGTSHYQTQFSDYRPVLIFRNYRDRQKSFLDYYCKNPHLLKGQSFTYDIPNIIGQWKNYNPIIYNLEEISKEPDFPHENQINTKTGLK